MLRQELFKLNQDIVEAMCWEGDNEFEILEFAGERLQPDSHPDYLRLAASDGKNWLVLLGDWIVKAKSGNIYSVKESTFKEYYKPIPID